MFISHQDASLYAVEFGAAPRTLVAHGGWAGSWELWTNPFTILSKTWRTIAYDHRGTGATIAPAESISLDAMTEDLFAVLDAMHVDSCVLAAESAGALVALNAAIQRPQRFVGLVLVDGLYFKPKPPQTEPFVLGLQANFEATIGAFVDACVLESEPDSDQIRRWGRHILSRASLESAVRLYECIDGIDLRPKLPSITIPTLIIHGEFDQIVPLDAAEWVSEQMPNSRLQVVKGAGHVPTVTRPQEVAEAINAYFSA
ncbi:MAG: alpha/beta hydrolase [Anaerolineae bacterium]|nr:alpha/beta hydrolase [Anaerolineae bacterium]